MIAALIIITIIVGLVGLHLIVRLFEWSSNKRNADRLRRAEDANKLYWENIVKEFERELQGGVS